MFYGPENSCVHHEAFGRLAAFAAEDLLALLRSAGHSNGTVVDLGCGSGILARAIGDAGYDVVGVDISAEMIALAQVNAPHARLKVGSLHDFDLPDHCVAVASSGEALNYATDPQAGMAAMERLAGRIFAALEPRGCWLFDVSGPGRGGPTRVSKEFHSFPDCCIGVTATESDEGSQIRRAITTFVVDEDGRYRRIEEHHVLQLYRPGEVAAVLRTSGFDVEVLGDYRSPPAQLNLPGWHIIEAHKPA